MCKAMITLGSKSEIETMGAERVLRCLDGGGGRLVQEGLRSGSSWQMGAVGQGREKRTERLGREWQESSEIVPHLWAEA